MLKLNNVSKKFGGKLVVDSISFHLDKPGVYGLLGTNGAGKTTTIRMLLGIINKDSGTITWNGQPVNRKDVNFGYLPEERGVYPKVKIIDQLVYFAELKGISRKTALEAIHKWAERLKVEEYLEMPAEKLSKGNQQKIQFMTAVIHNPDLVVLDEPFSGLDPVNTEILKNIIIDLVRDGKYVIMSAHQMSTIEEFCKDILILNQGKTVLQGNLKDIKSSYPATRVQIDTETDIAKYLKDSQLQIENEKNFQYTIKISHESEAEKLLQKLIKDNIKITKFEILKPTLNDIFIEKVGAQMKSHNLHDIWTVTKFTMRDMISRKSFRISTIIILVLIVIGFNIPNIISYFNGGDLSDTILISDPQDLYEGKLDQLNLPESTSKYEITPDTYEEIKTKLENGDISSAIMISKVDNTIKLDYVVTNAITLSTPPTQLIDTLSSLYTQLQIQKLNLSPTQLAQLSPTFQFEIVQTEDQEVGGNIGVMLVLSALLFFAIYFCAFQVSSSITVEKTSKIMETLVTSTSPHTIILGKTIGIGLVGLGQVLLFVITAILSAQAFLDHAVLESLFDLSNFTPYLAIATLVYFILGYFAYAFAYALTGATVAKPEDIQSANTPVAIITMIGFYLAYFTLMNPTSELNLIAALLPISSPFCMPLRIMMGVASIWEVSLSIIILVAFCAIIAHIAIRIYSNAILNYGNRMTIADIIKSYKEK